MKITPNNIAALVKSIGRSDAANYLVAEGHAATREEAMRMIPDPLADSSAFFKAPAAGIPIQKITLVDKGQDFLEWYVRDGIVIDCQPFQGQMWVGVKLIYPQGLPLTPGRIINLISPINGKVSNLSYPVAAIETLPPEEAAKVEEYGRKWADIKGVSHASLGL